MNEMDRMLGITGPLDAQGERDMNLYCRFVRNMQPGYRALPHLRLHYLNPASPVSWGWTVSLIRGGRPSHVLHCTGIELSTALELAREHWF